MGRSRRWKQKERVLFCSYILLMRRRGQPQRVIQPPSEWRCCLAPALRPARAMSFAGASTLSFQPEVADSTMLSITPPQKL
jgi:hypothetical protein